MIASERKHIQKIKHLHTLAFKNLANTYIIYSEMHTNILSETHTYTNIFNNKHARKQRHISIITVHLRLELKTSQMKAAATACILARTNTLEGFTSNSSTKCIFMK